MRRTARRNRIESIQKKFPRHPFFYPIFPVNALHITIRTRRVSGSGSPMTLTVRHWATRLSKAWRLVCSMDIARCRMQGPNVTTVSVVGGGSKSRYWSELLTSALQLPLSRHSGNDVSAALGAARLAMLATNAGVDAAKICTAPSITDVIEPNRDIAEAMQPRFERFKKLYATLSPMFQG